METKLVRMLAALLCAVLLLGLTACAVTPNTDGTAPGTGQTTGGNHTGSGGNTGGSNTGGANTPAPLYTRNGNKIYFGSYPQSKVGDSALISALNSQAGTLPTKENAREWTSYHYFLNSEIEHYMWYIDLAQGGEKYRGVYFVEYRNEDQERNRYFTDTVYWFKYDPISWKILEEKNGTALLFCDMIIDAQEYNVGRIARPEDGTEIYYSNYEYSTIRAWLNYAFYETAFTELQQQIIVTTEVKNDEESTDFVDKTYTCENTQDKVFILSKVETDNGKYGFDRFSQQDTAKFKSPTAYAQAQGAYKFVSTSVLNSDYAGRGDWWTRTAFPSGGYRVCLFKADGVFSNGNCFDVRGIVPALRIRL